MSETKEIYPSGKHKWKGNVDLKLFYKKIQKWLGEEDYDVLETSYGERIKPFGKQIEFVWTCTKEENSYFVKKIYLDFFTIGTNDVEVEREGKQLKLQKGELEIGFRAEIIFNASDEWHEGMVHTFYQNYIIGERIEEEKIKLYNDVHDLMSEMKTFLALYQLE